jgi:hypothetical protein
MAPAINCQTTGITSAQRCAVRSSGTSTPGGRAVGDDDQRAAAARACRAIIEVAKRDPDIRATIAKVCARHGVSNLFDLAEDHAEDVVMLADAITDLDREAPL